MPLLRRVIPCKGVPQPPQTIRPARLRSARTDQLPQRGQAMESARRGCSHLGTSGKPEAVLLHFSDRVQKRPVAHCPTYAANREG
jgi:hypothetical protein